MHPALIAIMAHGYKGSSPTAVVEDLPPPMTTPYKKVKPKGELSEAQLRAEAKRVRKGKKRLNGP